MKYYIKKNQHVKRQHAWINIGSMPEDPAFYIHSNATHNTDIEDIVEKSTPSVTALTIHSQFVDHLLQLPSLDSESISSAMIQLRKIHKTCPKNSDLIHALRTNFQGHANYDMLFRALVSTKVRSLSGVVVITVVTSPYPEVDGKVQKFSCAWNCYYCPNEPDQPRSYLHDEPAVIRANANRFDPVLQFVERATSLFQKGHPVDKIELIVLGGTWESYPLQYRSNFCRDLYFAANTFMQPIRERMSLEKEQTMNEIAACKIIGLTLETRPDTITTENIVRLRSYGCTRIQLGVQHTDNDVLKKINRKCTIEQVKDAIKLLKNACFKIDVHLMPNLPGASPSLDEEMFKMMLYDEDLQVDQWKVYPCEIVPWTIIKKWYEEGKFVPYSPAELKQVIISMKQKMHPWIRLNRVVRDIPSQYISNPSTPNLRNEIHKELKEMGTPCRCIRCRELGNREFQMENFKLTERSYQSSGATEIFLSFENQENDTIAAFLRLRLPSSYTIESMCGYAFVRELHVYGQTIATINTTVQTQIPAQHLGLGTRLLNRANALAKEYGYHGTFVISGVGTREYYKKKGYEQMSNGFQKYELPS